MKTKPCGRCSRILPIESFYTRLKVRSYKEGDKRHIYRQLLPRCKECENARTRKRHKQKMQDDPKYRFAIRERQNRNRERYKIDQMVSRAISRGEVIRLPCSICGAQKSEAHHHSYKPEDIFNVTFLCRKHHRAWHRVFMYEVK